MRKFEFVVADHVDGFVVASVSEYENSTYSPMFVRMGKIAIHQTAEAALSEVAAWAEKANHDGIDSLFDAPVIDQGTTRPEE